MWYVVHLLVIEYFGSFQYKCLILPKSLFLMLELQKNVVSGMGLFMPVPLVHTLVNDNRENMATCPLPVIQRFPNS